VRKHHSNVVAIGNGTACRETEELVSDLIATLGNPRPPAPPPAPPLPPPAVAPATETPALATPEIALETPSVLYATSSVPAVPPPPPPPPAPPPTEPPPVAADPPPAAAQPAPAPLPPVERTPVDLAYVIVNEAGASVYSASPVGREEFPNFDATLRGTISIGR